MDPLKFAYWLQGFAELNAAPPTAEQWQSIRDHLATVFEKVTPEFGAPEPRPGAVNEALRRLIYREDENAPITVRYGEDAGAKRPLVARCAATRIC